MTTGHSNCYEGIFNGCKNYLQIILLVHEFINSDYYQTSIHCNTFADFQMNA